ncbi:LacI family DNA-binding transcriptional regulator [Corynebacterium terpenotabidum]|uniref:LacI DNA-binding transcription regulator n=1 Tax=Corynebacterium terpenotabidum Y-11 TaxID=1200352 RepID=S4XAC3_9CORY|nr:LacI family DNA-binding transcriptional regulator [Corynebacterium terpenotabidum]AGP30087.1 LacI DNA-binding transcription regulator [Corynebacterium terpenotabidum Y-11]
MNRSSGQAGQGGHSRQSRRGTLASIAAELGVSRTTVSNAYNRPEQLSAELRERILRTAEAMGYAGPDPMARSLRTRHAGAIGVLLTDDMTYAFEDQASLEFMSGISEACVGMDTSMLLIPAGAETSEEDRPATLVNQAVVDGFIVYSVASDDPFLASVAARGVPTVICDQPADEHGINFVGIDDADAIRPAAQALVDAGHTRIGILCIRLDRDPNNGPVSAARLAGAHLHVQRDRVTGALDVLADAGIDRATVPIIERHLNTPETSASAAAELLENHPDLTAVICTTDSMALAVLDYADRTGLDVPGDLSVTGFDGIPRALDRGLSTVVQPNREKGFTSGNVLAALIRRREADLRPSHRQTDADTSWAEPEHRILLQTHWYEGTTVAAPAHPGQPRS